MRRKGLKENTRITVPAPPKDPRVKISQIHFPVVISPLVSLNNNRKRRTMKNEKIWSRVLVNFKDNLRYCRGTRNYETQNEEEAKS